MKTVWVFPGQGSQTVGMGIDLAQVGKEKLAIASEILGWSVLERCRGDATLLAQTEITQPCLLTISAILTDVLHERGARPHLVAGHSLGEYSALYAAGVLDFVTALRLVQGRSQRMAAMKDGAMVALLGADRQQLEAMMPEVTGQYGVVVLANDNSADQVVISGTVAAVQAVIATVKAKRAIPLPVSGAFHSPLMAEAAAEFSILLEQAHWASARCPVLTSGAPERPTTDPDLLRTHLQHQMTSPVRWRELCHYFAAQGFERALEVGAGKVLTGLIKRTAPQLQLININTLDQAESFIGVSHAPSLRNL
ncbi:MAG: ACP S-malonyltransferase [Oscillatoriales cyanobacterium SM2_2_1]|nr:ACP S-malonyltransferase [Oscillatoriales cyanobacterium SM2_2_1]